MVYNLLLKRRNILLVQLIVLLLLCRHAVSQESPKRLSTVVTTYLYRDSFGKECSFTEDSIHYGYIDNRSVGLKFNGYSTHTFGLPDDVIHNAMPLRCDSIFYVGYRYGLAIPRMQMILNRYDKKGNLVCKKQYVNLDAHGLCKELRFESQTNYTYDEHNKCILEVYQQQATPRQKAYMKAKKYSYNSLNSIVSEIDSDNWHSPVSYMQSSLKTSYTYDEQNRLTRISDSTWDDSLNTFITADYPTQDYNYSDSNNTKIICINHLHIRPEDVGCGNIDQPIKSVFKYSYEGRLLTSIKETTIFGAIHGTIGCTLEKFTYDNSDRLTTEIDSTISDMPSSLDEGSPRVNYTTAYKIEWKYDSYGRPLSRITYPPSSSFYLSDHIVPIREVHSYFYK